MKWRHSHCCLPTALQMLVCASLTKLRAVTLDKWGSLLSLEQGLEGCIA